jgi:hypothetical protein
MKRNHKFPAANRDLRILGSKLQKAHQFVAKYALRTIIKSVQKIRKSTNQGCMYIDFQSWYSAYALVLPSRCAEAVRLDRFGHNRERTGREVHPLSGVVGSQRDVRRHVGCCATNEEL